MAASADRLRAALEARIARACQLEREHPASAEALACYAEVARIQQTLAGELPRVLAGTSPAPFTLAGALDLRAVSDLIPDLLPRLERVPQGDIATMAAMLAEVPQARWRARVEAYCAGEGRDAGDDDETAAFVVETLVQPFAEALAFAAGTPARGDDGESAAQPSPAERRCPFCRGLPLVATLRERGYGARRSLVCGRCLTEWPSPRIVCPSCGERGFEALPVYRADEFPAMRLAGCERCHVAIKTVDLTVSGAAIPIVDDLASLPLDLWAAEQGFHKLRPNLLRL